MSTAMFLVPRSSSYEFEFLMKLLLQRTLRNHHQRFLKSFETFQNGPLNRGAFKDFHLSQKCLKSKILHLTSLRGRFKALTASQVEDFGLQAILEKMNPLITPLVSAPFLEISNIFGNVFDIFSNFGAAKILLKLTLGVRKFVFLIFVSHMRSQPQTVRSLSKDAFRLNRRLLLLFLSQE